MTDRVSRAGLPKPGTTIPTLPPPPAGLSTWAKTVWRDLLTDSHFERHELVLLTRALTWFDVADRLLREGKVRQASTASATAMSLWRVLRFTDPSRPAPRLGRPPTGRWYPQPRPRAGGAA